MTCARGEVKGLSDNQAVIVDGIGDAVGKWVERAEIRHPGFLAPIKRVGIEGRIFIARRIAKSHDFTFAIHAVWRVPRLAAQIAHIDGSAVLVLPEHGVDGARATHRIRAFAGDPRDLPFIVNGVGGTVRIPRIDLQRSDLCRFHIVNVWQKLQNLGWIASGVLERRFRPSDDLILVVDTSRETIIASEGWQSTDETRRLPEKAQASVAAGRKEASRNTTKSLSAGLNCRSVRNADDQPLVILDALPGNGAVGSTDRAQF